MGRESLDVMSVELCYLPGAGRRTEHITLVEAVGGDD
jgi:hypothetical protein